MPLGHQRGNAGFTLLEILIALGFFSFLLMTIIAANQFSSQSKVSVSASATLDQIESAILVVANSMGGLSGAPSSVGGTCPFTGLSAPAQPVSASPPTFPLAAGAIIPNPNPAAPPFLTVGATINGLTITTVVFLGYVDVLPDVTVPATLTHYLMDLQIQATPTIFNGGSALGGNAAYVKDMIIPLWMNPAGLPHPTIAYCNCTPAGACQ